VPAVFVHGVPERAAIWDDVRDHLGRDDHIAVALPGFDAPVPGGFACTMDDYAGWLTAGVEAVAGSNGPVDLVGRDWGGLLTIRVASTRPDLLRSWCSDAAAILDPAATWHTVAAIWQDEGAGEDFMAGAEAASQADREAAVVGLGVPADRARLCSLGDPAMDAAILTLYRSATEISDQWGSGIEDAGTLPGLVLHGQHDPFLDEEACCRVTARAGADHDVLPSLGHWWCLEDPKGAAARLERFWSKVA
jgi:pimeloyl-ACP methyl ester carboxylesterase